MYRVMEGVVVSPEGVPQTLIIASEGGQANSRCAYIIKIIISFEE